MSRFDVFDVFEVLPDGEVLWHQAVADLTEAQRLAEEKARATRNSFFVFDQVSREKLFVQPAVMRLQTEPGKQSQSSVHP